jgi:hypothetical protein
MSLMDNAVWLAAGLAAGILLGMWAGRGRSRRDHGSSTSRAQERAPAQGLDDRMLRQVRDDVRNAMDKQADHMRETRTRWDAGIQRLEGKIDELARRSAAARASAPPAPGSPGRAIRAAEYALPAMTLDAGGFGADSLRGSSSTETSWAAGPGDRPVEIREGVLVASMSLPPAAYVAPDGGGRARVYLNPDAPINEFALPKWEAFFDLAGAKPYAAYRTRRPAEVRWDDVAARGELISKGTAEAI